MKLLKLSSVLSLFLALYSCGDMEDLLYMFDKTRYDAYITNETDCDVTIRRKYFYKSDDGSYDSLYHIKAGQELEIPITDRWSMSLHTFEYDTVWFYFSDSTTCIHTAHRLRDIKGFDSMVYVPKDYNILKIDNLSTNPEDNCWEKSKIKGRHYRYDFYITEK